MVDRHRPGRARQSLAGGHSVGLEKERNHWRNLYRRVEQDHETCHSSGNSAMAQSVQIESLHAEGQHTVLLFHHQDALVQSASIREARLC